ncbi:MAG: DUF192 domain-containing protein [Thermodesulfobacteriota bacterium]
MKLEKYFPLPVCCILLWVLAFSLPAIANDVRTVEIVINKKAYVFELADTALKRKNGLMFRQNLGEISGMLFVYPEEQHRNFYMKHTYIPLDIAFINRDLQVIKIHGMRPLDKTSVRSGGRAKYALEAERGLFQQAGLEEGDKIHFVGPTPRAAE